MNESELRRQIITYGIQMNEDRLIQGTWGNLSIRLDEEYFLITPSGISYDALKEEDISKVKISDGSYEGDKKPSSEREMHRRIYLNRRDVNAVVHTHSENCVIFSALRKDLEYEDNTIRCAKYGVSGTKGLAENVVKALGNEKGALMANHGAVFVGKDMEEAYRMAYETEKEAGRKAVNET